MKNTPKILQKNTPHVWAISDCDSVIGSMRVLFTGHTIHGSLELFPDVVFVSNSQKDMSEDYQICLVVSQLIRKFGDTYKNDDFVQALHCNTLGDIYTRFEELGYYVTKIF